MLTSSQIISLHIFSSHVANRLPSEETDTATRVQIFDEAFCVSLPVDILEKDMRLSHLLQTRGK